MAWNYQQTNSIDRLRQRWDDTARSMAAATQEDNNLVGFLKFMGAPLGLAVGGSLDALNYLSAAVTGTLLGGAAMLPGMEGTGLREAVERAARANEADENSDWLEEVHRINESVASEHPYLTGAANMLLDPTNLLTGGLTKAGVIKKAEPVVTKARTIGERLGDLKDGAQAVGTILKLAHGEGAAAQKLAEAGGITVTSPRGKQYWRSLRQKLDVQGAWSNWKAQMVLTPRNLAQDYSTGRLWAAAEGIPGEEINHAIESMAHNAATTGAASTDVLPTRISNVIDAFGWNPATAPKGLGFDVRQELGIGFLDMHAVQDQYLSPWTTAGLGAATAMANPLKGGVPVLGVAASAAKEYYRAYQNAAFSTISHILQGGMRSVAWDVAFGDELAKAAPGFLAKLDPKVASALRAESELRWNNLATLGENMSMYDKHSLFTPEDVRTAMRGRKGVKAAVSAWENAALDARVAGSDLAKKTFGDFSPGKSEGERYLDMLVPFLSWARRAYPRTLEIAAEHPTATARILELMRTDQQLAEREGRPDWEVGTIPVSSETPLVGGAVRALNGGRQGEVRINPMQGFFPIPSDALAAAGDINTSNAYTTVQGLLNVAGAGLSPAAEIGAYGVGATNRTPRALDRFAGVEGAMPGPELPSLLNGPLNAVRDAQGRSTIKDPVVRVAQELVFEKTGLPVSDPRNKQYALDILHQAGIYQNAEGAYDLGQAAKNIVGFFNPTGLTAASDTAIQARQAQADAPFEYKDVQALRKIDPKLAAAAQRAIDQDKMAHPAAAIYDSAKLSAQDRQDPRLTKWEYEHRNVKALAPQLYEQLRSEFIRANAIKTGR